MLAKNRGQANSEDKTTVATTTVPSQINYGGELSLRRAISDDWNFLLTAGAEHVSVSAPDNVTITGDNQTLLKFAVGLDYMMAEYFAMNVMGAYQQRPLTRSAGTVTNTVTNIDAVFIPEASLGARLRFVTFGDSSLWLVGDGIIALAATDNGYGIHSGYGYDAGLRFDFKMMDSTLSLTPMYRFLSYETSNTRYRQDAVLLNLAWGW